MFLNLFLLKAEPVTGIDKNDPIMGETCTVLRDKDQRVNFKKSVYSKN